MNPILPRVQMAMHHMLRHRLAVAIILPSLLTIAPPAAQATAANQQRAPRTTMPDNGKRLLRGTVTDENGNKLAEGTTSVTVNADIGTKITVKAVVITAAGTWRGSVEHTVTAGTNIVAVKLSKTPKNMGNILSSVISQDSGGDAKVTFKLASGKELLNDVAIGPNRIIPVIARDGIGRIYVLYDKGSRHFTRFDAEGNEDAGFETAIKGILQGFDIGRIKTMTVDPKTGTLFVAVVTSQPDIYAVTETSHNTFTRSNGFNLASFIGSGNTIQTAAAYNGTLFFTVPPPSSFAKLNSV